MCWMIFYIITREPMAPWLHQYILQGLYTFLDMKQMCVQL